MVNPIFKKCIVFLFCIQFFWFEPIYAQGVSEKITLLSKYNNPNLPRLNGYQIWNDLTGYYDSLNKKEYIIAGSTDSIYFFDVSNPSIIKLCAVQDGKAKKVVNRDYECYSHYVYCVSDNGGKGSLQVFDLQYLPDSVHKVYDSDSLSYNTHSIFIEAKSKRLYLCVNMDIMSLEQPERPAWIGRLNVPTFGDGVPVFRNVHEVYVRNDTAYCSIEYRGLWIFDLRDLSKQRLISTITDYPENGYNHSSTLDATGKFIMFTDEIPGGLSVKIFDINDIFNPKLVSMYKSNDSATAHNAYWIGSFAYVSYYHDGVYIFDLSDKSKPVKAGYYHTSTWPPSSYAGYKGCWGIYPYLPSGILAASDMGEGIFLLRVDPTLTSVKKESELEEVFSIYPNPFGSSIHFNYRFKNNETLDIKLYNGKGELVLHKNLSEATFEAETSNLGNGMYFVVLQSGDKHWVQKLIKQ
jgi:choice-of-anchor B domain-containing protein